MAEVRTHKEKKDKKHKEREKKPRKVILEVDNVSDVSIEESFETDSCSSDGSGCRVYSISNRPDKVFHVQTREGRQKILQRMASESARGGQSVPVKEKKDKKDKKLQEKAEKFPWLNSEATSSSVAPPKEKSRLKEEKKHKEKKVGAAEIKKAPTRP